MSFNDGKMSFHSEDEDSCTIDTHKQKSSTMKDVVKVAKKCHQPKNATPSSSKRKKLSFRYSDESEDDENNSSPDSNSALNDGLKKIGIKERQACIDKSESQSKKEIPMDNVSSAPTNQELDCDDSSSTSSCSCEDHSSIDGPNTKNSDDMQHEDLDYGDEEDEEEDEKEKEGKDIVEEEPLNEKKKASPTLRSVVHSIREASPTRKLASSSDISAHGITIIKNSSTSKTTDQTFDRFARRNHDRSQDDMRPKIDRRENTKKEAASEQSNSSSSDNKSLLRHFLKDACYFLIKSINEENINISKSLQVWSTSPRNEVKLNKAFRKFRSVILVFSVQQSGKFQGFARMRSESSRREPPVEWVLPRKLSLKSLGGVIKLDWLCTKSLSFDETNHLRNSYNENKPVKIARDGQQIESRIGKSLCRLFPESSNKKLEAKMKDLRHQLDRKIVPPNKDDELIASPACEDSETQSRTHSQYYPPHKPEKKRMGSCYRDEQFNHLNDTFSCYDPDGRTLDRYYEEQQRTGYYDHFRREMQPPMLPFRYDWSSGPPAQPTNFGMHHMSSMSQHYQHLRSEDGYPFYEDIPNSYHGDPMFENYRLGGGYHMFNYPPMPMPPAPLQMPRPIGTRQLERQPMWQRLGRRDDDQTATTTGDKSTKPRHKDERHKARQSSPSSSPDS